MAGSGQARPPDTHQKVVLHPQVGGRASGTTSTAVDPTFPPLLNTFTPVLPEGNRTQKRTFGEALELLEDAGHIRQPDPSNSRLKEPAGPTNNKSWTASGRTFASVRKSKALSRFPAIHLAPRQYGSKDGKPSISFTPAELQVGVDYLRYSLVAKFSDGRPHIEEIRKAFSTAYTLHGQSSIGAWDALIVLDSEEDARRVLAHPMRKVGHSLFRVFRWTKDFSTRREPTSTTTWIRLTNLPPELYNQGYIEPIISSFGRFLAMDNRTTNFTNSSFARVCAEVDTSNVLPDEVWISTGNASGFWQELVFENRLEYCYKCKLHGHLMSNCRKMKQKQEEEKKIWAARDEHGLPTASSVVSVFKAAEDGDRSVPLGKGRTTQAIDDKDVEWTVVRKRKGKQRSMHKEQRQQVSQDVNKNRKSSARGKTEQAMAPQRITCHLKKSCSLGDLSKADLSKAGTILKDKNGPQNTAHLEKDLTKLGPDRESQPIRREDMDQVDVVNDIGQQMADPTDEALNGENGNGSSGDPTDEALNEENENGWTDSDPGLASARQIAKENEIISHSENNENEIAHQISSLGNASFYCEDLGGWVRPRAFYTYLRASCEDDDSIILHAMTERVNGNRQAQQEGSGTIEESNHEVAHNSANDLGDQEVSVVPPPVPTKSRHRKKKATRSSSRACPKKKDTNFVW